jgi:hypothetical protein
MKTVAYAALSDEMLLTPHSLSPRATRFRKSLPIPFVPRRAAPCSCQNKLSPDPGNRFGKSNLGGDPADDLCPFGVNSGHVNWRLLSSLRLRNLVEAAPC